MKNGEVCWFEVLGQDTTRLRAFYGEVVGWKLRPIPEMDYAITPEDWTGVPGAVGQAPAGPGWSTFYVRVDDVQRAIDRAVALGGRVLMPPMVIRGGTTVAVVGDPEEHPVGLWSEA